MNKKLVLPLLLILLSGVFSINAAPKNSSTPELSISYYIGALEMNKSFSKAIKDNFSIQMPTMSLVNASLEVKLFNLSERSSLHLAVNGGYSKANEAYTNLNLSSFRVDALYRYSFVQKKHFAFSGLGGLGYGTNFLRISTSEGSMPPNASIGQILAQSRDFRLAQKGIGAIILGVQADWLIDEIGSLGIFVRWSQQLGPGSYYTANYKTKVDQLNKSQIFPLEMGLILSIRNKHE